ncbi:hypothetical protein HYC85_012673 [Camellia sinensis]|uniref:Uncharacterized protein n=1 Tax=Camellia sinensis TaxID=4442 RepID=A0A7J7HCM3_CAMSI|nr:hypothetical protein HYC85_012673 [Camellia sinensis]
MGRKCHPLLRGGRRETKYSHGFSAAQMESLASVCEAILPPLPFNSLDVAQNQAQTNKKSIQFFHKASGSHNPVPDEIAEMIVKRTFFEAVILLKLVLAVLSTRLGTLLLCGSLCLCGDKWPYIKKFSDISLEKREKVIQKWLRHSFFTPIRLAFVFIKFLCLFVFFSQPICPIAGNRDDSIWPKFGLPIILLIADNLSQDEVSKLELSWADLLILLNHLGQDLVFWNLGSAHFRLSSSLLGPNHLSRDRVFWDSPCSTSRKSQ